MAILRLVDFTLTPAQQQLAAAARAFSDKEIEPFAAAMDREGRLPDALLPKMASAGFLGLTIPSRFGGSGAGHLSCVLALEQLAYSGAGAWWLAGFNNSIGASLASHGSGPAVERHVAALCTGAAYASIQFTEDATGSDPDALTTSAHLANGRFILNGRKRFSTFGARPGPAMLFAKDEAGGCSAFVVDKNAPGYTAGPLRETMGGGGVEPADVAYHNLVVPQQALLGKRGEGFAILLEWVASEKVQQCAANVGYAQAALDEAVRFANARQARGRPISAMQGIRWILAEMKGKVEASRWLTYRAASVLDARNPAYQEEAALTKVFVVPATIEVAEMSRRIHGAYGYTREYKIERLCRAIAGATGVATSLEVNKSIVGGAVSKGW